MRRHDPVSVDYLCIKINGNPRSSDAPPPGMSVMVTANGPGNLPSGRVKYQDGANDSRVGRFDGHRKCEDGRRRDHQRLAWTRLARLPARGFRPKSSAPCPV